MSEHQPKTESYEKFKKFMALNPEERDEVLWFQDARFKSIIESDSLLEYLELMRGTKDQPGLPLRMDWMEKKIKRLVASNAKLQAAIYVATGAWITVKFYFEFIHK